MTPVEQLQKARDYLMENGWCQGGGRHKDDPERCVHLALAEVQDNAQRLDSDYANAARNYLLLAIGETGGYTQVGLAALWNWNDADERTFNDVADMYDRAILLAKEDEARGLIEQLVPSQEMEE